MGEITDVDLDSDIGRRTAALRGLDVYHVICEASAMVGGKRACELFDCAKGVVESACDVSEESSDDDVEMILVLAAGIHSLMATLIAWVDQLNLRIEIDDIERGII